MQPIFYNSFLTALPWLIGAAALLLAGIFLSTRSTMGKSVAGIIVIAVSVFGFLFIPVGSTITTRSAEREARIAEVNEVYGLGLLQQDFSKLEYPEYLPEGDFQAYGTANVTSEKDNGELVRSQLTLIWQDGEFRLFQGEGAVTELEELPRSE